MRPTKCPDIPVSLERNTDVFRQHFLGASSTLLISTGGPTPLLCLEGVPDLPVAPQVEAGLTTTFQTGLVRASTLRSTPISRSPLDKNPMPGHLSELHPVNEVNTKGQFFRASFGKKPQVPNTARQAASLPGDISRGRRSSMPQPKTRPDSPVPSLQGPCDRSLKSEVPCGSCLNWR